MHVAATLNNQKVPWSLKILTNYLNKKSMTERVVSLLWDEQGDMTASRWTAMVVMVVMVNVIYYIQVQ